jgi:hypothetical protein
LPIRSVSVDKEADFLRNLPIYSVSVDKKSWTFKKLANAFCKRR